MGLGVSVVVPLTQFPQTLWLVYSGITERTPLSAAAARVQFTKSSSNSNTSLEGVIGVDYVLLAPILQGDRYPLFV